MLKMLFADSYILNTKVIEQDTQEFLDSLNIEHIFYEVSDPQSVFETIEKTKPQIAFINISCKKFNGIDLLKKIKKLNLKNLTIIAVTTLSHKENRYEALKEGVYSFIYKPYDYIEIRAVLQKYLDKGINSCIEIKPDIKEQETQSDDDFICFDDEDDGFMDFDINDDVDDEVDEHSELMDEFNKSHKKVSASEFLQEYSSGEFDVYKFADLEENLDSLIASLLFENDIASKIEDIIELMDEYRSFLYDFSEFDELSNVLGGFIDLLDNIDFEKVDRIKIVSKFIVAIIQDLVDWKNHVFIQQDAVDVYYINASILNSFLQLKELLNE